MNIKIRVFENQSKMKIMVSKSIDLFYFHITSISCKRVDMYNIR